MFIHINAAGGQKWFNYINMEKAMTSGRTISDKDADRLLAVLDDRDFAALMGWTVTEAVEYRLSRARLPPSTRRRLEKIGAKIAA